MGWLFIRSLRRFFCATKFEWLMRNSEFTVVNKVAAESSAPQSLEKHSDIHLRCPEDKFRLQARVLAAYQMNEPQEFYNKEDQWKIVQLPGANANEESKPMSLITRL